MDKKELNALVGKNIKREREKGGYTQEQFAEMLGIGPKSLSAIERGVVGVSLSTLLKICDMLCISTNALLLPYSRKNDARSMAQQLEALTPEQFDIASDVITSLLKAFSLEK